MMHAFELHAITRRYNPAVTAVDAVSLVAEPGATLALLGPSGCGKTTLLRLLAGLEVPDGGTITLGGRAVAGNGTWVPPEQRGVGLVFQDYALFPHLNVAENIGFGLPRRPQAQRTARIGDLLALVGLHGLAERYPHELSGGQQQRVALARALAPQPQILLLDEPFSNLDAALRREMRSEVHRIVAAAATTAVLVTHDQEDALSFADQVAVMFAGRIAQIAPPQQMYRAPGNPAIAAFVGEANFVDGTADGDVVQTALGTLALTHQAHGAVRVLVRPEWVLITPDDAGQATVQRVLFFGHDSLLDLRLHDGTALRVRARPNQQISPGTSVRLVVDVATVAFTA